MNLEEILYIRDGKNTQLHALVWQEFMICHLKTCCFSLLMIFSWRYLGKKKTANTGKTFLSIPLIGPKTNSLWKQNITNTLSKSFINRKDWLITEEGTRSWTHIQTNFVACYYISHLLKAHLFFLKVIYSLLSCLHLPFCSLACCLAPVVSDSVWPYEL